MPLQGFLNAIVYAWTREDFLQVMGIWSLGINNDDTTTVGYDEDGVSDMERSMEGSYTSNRALEDSASMMSVRSIPVDCPIASVQYERRESIAADYHRENPPYLSDHDCYNTI